MNLKTDEIKTGRLAQPEISGRLKVFVVIATVFGIGLFFGFVYSAGVGQIADNVVRFGIVGFLVILATFFLRICLRATAWSLSVHEP